MIEHRPADDPVALIEAATEQLGDPAQSEVVPLTELTERLMALHGQLQSALSELDRA